MPTKPYKNLTKSKLLAPRKIVFLVRLFHPHIGGVEKHALRVAQECMKRGHTIVVVTEQHDPHLPLYEVYKGIEIYRIPHSLLSGKLGIWSWIFNHIVLFLQANIIHAHDVFWWYLPLHFLLYWKPIFTTFHGYESLVPTQKAIQSRKITERLSQGSICIGGWIQKWYGTQPNYVLYGAAEVKPVSLPRNQKTVFIGRLAEDTGILTYMKGVQLLGGRIQLDIYGEGELLNTIKQYIKKTPYIRYKGVSDSPETIVSQYRFAFTSQYLSMIEAMQCGRYVFAGWSSELKKDYLKSFPAIKYSSVFSSPEELAKEVLQVVKHPQEELKKIKYAQEWAFRQTWSHVTTIYEELWQKSH